MDGYWTSAGPADITSATRKGSSIRVCIYTRISTDEENQPTSLHSQRERLEAFCASQDGWRIVAHEEDRSTGTKLERPGSAGCARPRARRQDRSAVRLPRRSALAEGAPVGAARRRARPGRGDVALGDGAVRHRCGGGPDDVADVGGVRGVRARDDRRPHHAPGSSGARRKAAGRPASSPSATAATNRRTSSPTSTQHRSSAASSTCTRMTGSAPPRSRGCSTRRACAGAGARLAARGRAVGLGERGVSRPGALARRELPGPARAARRRGHVRACAGAAEGARRGPRRGGAATAPTSCSPGSMRCGRCERAYVGMSAKGNGGIYLYYACSGRQKLGPKAATANGSTATSSKPRCSTSSPASTATAT